MTTTKYSGFVCDGVPITAVSSILRSDNKHKSGRKSAALTCRSASAKQMFATDRGIKVHRAVNTFLSTGEVDLEEKHFPYFRNIYEQLEVLEPTDIIWNEGPVLPEHQHLRQGEYSCVWDSKRGYGGVPDLIATIGSVRCLFEWKTSHDLYQSSYKYKDFKNYSKYLKYSHAAMQVAAYSNCVEKTMGIKIDCGIIITATRDESQLFIVDEQLPKYLKDFHKLNSAYRKQHF